MSVPVRAEAAVFAATENPTEPFPVPLAPLLIVIQLALLTAVHPQVARFAFTPTVPRETDAPTEAEVAVNEYPQAAA